MHPFTQYISPRFAWLSRLARAFEAIGHDCRLEIIILLGHSGSLPSWEIARLTNCSASATSQSLAKLRDAGLLTVSRIGKEVYYAIDHKSLLVRDLLATTTRFLD